MSSNLPLPLDIRLMNLTASALITALLLAGIGAGLWWVLRHPVFAISQITVTGDTQHHTAASLRAEVATQLSGNFFTLDLNKTRAAFEHVPWVRRAMVRREFPGRLTVDLQEHVPVARWGDDETRLVNRQGEVFEVGGLDADQAGLPLLLGPDGQAADLLERLGAFSRLLQPLQSHISVLELQLRGHWHLELDSGVEVELGQGGAPELARRLGQFAATAAEVAGRHGRTVTDIEEVDLRHVDGYALRLRGVVTGEQAADSRARAGR